MVVALTAGWSTSAAALPLLPPPPITLPTLTLPTVTVPPVDNAGRDDACGNDADGAGSTAGSAGAGVPHVTPPALQPPPSRPQSDSGPAGVGRSAGEANQGGRAETSREQASRLRLARDWIAQRGADGKRRTTLVFILRRPALVEFVVLQVAPDCRRVGRFRVRGHRGVNRVRVPNRVGREPLAPGTYRVVARAVPARSNGRTRAARRRRSREPRRDPSGPESRLVCASVGCRSVRPGPTTGRSSQRSGPRRSVRGTRRATTECSERGSPGQRFSAARKTFRSGSTSCSASRSRCSERRRSAQDRDRGPVRVAPVGPRRRHDPPRLDDHVRARLRAAKDDRRGLR